MLKVYYNAVESIYLNYIEKAEAWDMYAQHYHNGYEFYLLLEGKRKFTVNNYEFELNSGEFLIIKPYDLHYSQKIECEFSRYIMNFSVEELNLFLDKKEIEFMLENLNTGIVKLDKKQQERIIELFENISKNINSNKIIGKKLGIIYLISLIDYIKNLSSSNIKLYKNDNQLRLDMIEAMKFINENYANSEFSLDDMINHICMSKSRFCELFKETTGYSFLKYLNELRLRQVEMELRTTDKSLKIISEENGFSSVANMSRNFIKKFNISPTDYRLKKRKN